MRYPVPTEAQEQRTVIEWAGWNPDRLPGLELLFHIPNGGSRNTIEAHNLKLQGVKSGVPDLFLPVARGKWHGLFIEMKKQKGGRASANQQEWIEALNKQGYLAQVCRGADEAIELIRFYYEERS